MHVHYITVAFCNQWKGIYYIHAHLVTHSHARTIPMWIVGTYNHLHIHTLSLLCMVLHVYLYLHIHAHVHCLMYGFACNTNYV